MKKRTSSQLTIEAISPYFTQSIQTASKKLGVCCTLLKKICRKYGITRWPYRKIQSIERSIQQTKERLQFLEQIVVEEQNGNAYNEMLKLRTELFELERKRESLFRPDRALINPYSLEPNYMLSLDTVPNDMGTLEGHSSLWTLLSSQEQAQQRRALVEQQTDNSGTVRPLSPVLSLDSSEPEYSGHSSSCDNLATSRYPKERFEDYNARRYPPEVTSEVSTTYSEGDVRKNHLVTRNASLHADSSYDLPWKMQWARDSTTSSRTLQQNSCHDKMSSYTVSQGFSSFADEDQLFANRLQQQPSSSTERDTVWNGMEVFGTLNRTVDRGRTAAHMKPFTGMDDRGIYDSLPDDMILSNVTSTDDMSTIDENMSYEGEYGKGKAIKQEMGLAETCWDGQYLQKTLFNAFQRMELLEQENKQLRSKLSRLLGHFPVQAEEVRREEQCNFYKGFPSSYNALETGVGKLDRC